MLWFAVNAPEYI